MRVVTLSGLLMAPTPPTICPPSGPAMAPEPPAIVQAATAAVSAGREERRFNRDLFDIFASPERARGLPGG